MLRKIAIMIIAVAIFYLAFSYLQGGAEHSADNIVSLVSERRADRAKSSAQGSELFAADKTPKTLGRIDDDLSRSSLVIRENLYPFENQLSQLAEIYRPNAEVIASVERFESTQLELLEDLDEIITMKEKDFSQTEDQGDIPTYAENRAHKSDDVYELSLFTQFIGECFRRGFKDRPACVGVYGVNINKLSVLTPRAIGKLDELARQGDLLAQSLYHASLLSAVDSFDMNTARDPEIWLQRRQRMIGFSLRFAKAGSKLAAQQLGRLFDDGDYIKPQPFWAAVFYSQSSLLGGNGDLELQRLISKHSFDEIEIEQARQDMFDDGSY